MFHKIICVDDDPIALMLSKLVISKSDHKVEIITAISGQDAINYLSKNEVITENKLSNKLILILLDLNMPVMDGWEFLKQFKNNLLSKYDNSKIVLLTSSIDPIDIEKSKNFSMVIDFLPKPLTKESLNLILSKIQNECFYNEE